MRLFVMARAAAAMPQRRRDIAAGERLGSAAMASSRRIGLDRNVAYSWYFSASFALYAVETPAQPRPPAAS